MVRPTKELQCSPEHVCDCNRLRAVLHSSGDGAHQRQGVVLSTGRSCVDAGELLEGSTQAEVSCGEHAPHLAQSCKAEDVQGCSPIISP